jgi:hypothetical protein
MIVDGQVVHANPMVQPTIRSVNRWRFPVVSAIACFRQLSVSLR